MKLLLDLEGIFFASGKAPVVLGVALIIVLGLGIWMYKMDRNLKDLARKSEKMEVKLKN